MNTIYEKIKNRSAYAIETSEDTYEEQSAIPASMEKIIGTPVTTRQIDYEAEFQEDLNNDIELMLQYCLQKGKKVTTEIGVLLNSSKLLHRVILYNLLQKSIEPAPPNGIHYLSQYQKESTAQTDFFTIPLVRHFTILAMIFIVLITFGLYFTEIITENSESNIPYSDTSISIANWTYSIVVAGLGGLFYFLLKLIRQVREATLTRDQIPYYWIGLLLGILSGIFFSESQILYPYLTPNNLTNHFISALMGGFIGDILYKILKKIYQKVTAILAVF